MPHDFHHPSLLPLSDWVRPHLDVADHGMPVRFHLREMFHYHGYDAVGGVVLGFRLAQRAFALLSPEADLPERTDLGLLTPFPGLGLRDVMELTTRMVRDGRYHLGPTLDHPEAPEGAEGKFYFRFRLDGSSVDMAPAAGYPGPDFVRLGKASKQPSPTPGTMAAWRRAKFDLANTLLGLSPEQAVRIL